MSAVADASQVQHRGGLGGIVGNCMQAVLPETVISIQNLEKTPAATRAWRGELAVAAAPSPARLLRTSRTLHRASSQQLQYQLDNLALDESLIGPKDAGRVVEKSLPQGKECSRSKAKNLGNSLAALTLGNISYAYDSSAKVNYTKNVLARSQLVEMRQTLLDKCEEIVNLTEWPFGQFSLSTEKIFSDLLQYHGGESDGLNHSLGFR